MVQDETHSFALEFRLRELDSALHRRFTDGVFCMQKILSNYKLIFPEFTDHTELHSLSVIDFCNRLIGSQLERMNKDEIYVLLLSCYFHDTGMGITRKDFEEFSAKIDFGDYFQKNPGVTMQRQIRDFHNEYSGLFIRKYAELFEIPSDAHLKAIFQISRGHRKTDLMDERVYPVSLPTPNGSSICLPYLSALVRLADEIDVTSARNPILLYDIQSLINEKGIIYYRINRAVKELLIDKDTFTLVIDDSDPVLTEEIEHVAEKMLSTLHVCRAAVNGRTPYVITQRNVRIQGKDMTSLFAR